MIEGFQNGLFRDFAKDHSADRNFWFEQFDQVPADALSFAVFVCREDEFVGLFQGSFQLVDDLLFPLRDDVERFEFAVDVDADS